MQEVALQQRKGSHPLLKLLDTAPKVSCTGLRAAVAYAHGPTAVNLASDLIAPAACFYYRTLPAWSSACCRYVTLGAICEGLREELTNLVNALQLCCPKSGGSCSTCQCWRSPEASLFRRARRRQRQWQLMRGELSLPDWAVRAAKGQAS